MRVKPAQMGLASQKREPRELSFCRVRIQQEVSNLEEGHPQNLTVLAS